MIFYLKGTVCLVGKASTAKSAAMDPSASSSSAAGENFIKILSYGSFLPNLPLFEMTFLLEGILEDPRVRLHDFQQQHVQVLFQLFVLLLLLHQIVLQAMSNLHDFLEREKSSLTSRRHPPGR